MSRRAAVSFVFALLAVVIVAVARAGNAIVGTHHGDGHQRTIGRGQVAFDRHGGEYWWNRYRREHRAVKNLAAQVRRQRRLLRRLQAAPSRTTQSASTGSSVPAVICVVFPDCSKALSVAR